MSDEGIRKNQSVAERNADYCTGRNDGFAAGLVKATQMCERRADSLVEGAAVARQCASDIRALIDTNPGVVVPLDVARLIRKVFLPTNPNKMRSAHPDTVAAAKAFIAAVEAQAHG